MSLLFGVVGEGLQKSDAILDRCVSSWRAYSHGVRPRAFSDKTCLLVQSRSFVTPQDHVEYRLSRHGDGRFVLVLDGWLANRDELVRVLPAALADTPNDGTLIAAALLQWGEAALLRLHGDFALAWWDTLERRLLLACDRTGGRTLFYHRADRRIYFSNLLDTLFAQPEVPRQVLPDQVVRSAFLPVPELVATCFQGISRLEPAHKLVWSPESQRVERYWRIDTRRRIRFARDGEYVEAARELLDKVVAGALPSGGPLLCNLSGGLDSTAVAATAARLFPTATVHTLTLRPEASSPLPPIDDVCFCDEWPYAQAVAANYPNMVPHAVETRFDWEKANEVLWSHMPFWGQPTRPSAAKYWYQGLVDATKALDARVLVGGLSGNCTLSASALSVMQYVRLQDFPAALADAWLRVRSQPGRRSIKQALYSLAPPAVRAWHQRRRKRDISWRTRMPLTTSAAERIDMDGVWQAHLTGDDEVPWRLRSRVRLLERSWLGRARWAPQRFLDGVERRDPLGDIRLAEFCLALPLDQFTRPGMDRALARRVLADRLPSVVLNERRIGRQFPEWFDWLTRSRPMLSAELDRIEASSLGRTLIDVPRLRAILDDWPTDAAAAEKHYERLGWVLGGGAAMGAFLRWAEGGNE